jgi:DNA-directed RNA polymerase beta' subunit
VYNELSLPWGLSIGQLEIHLTSKLIKRVFTQEEMVRWDLPASELTQAQIKTFLYKHVTKYNELIELLFKELIDEAVDGCLYMLFVRYPSMSRGSLHLLPIRHIKNNPADQTIGMPEILVSTYNADFDGDQMTAMLVLDHYHAELYKPLLTHNNLRDPNNPGKHTPVVTISKPVSLSIARYIVKGDKEVATPTQAERMLALFAN